eukprot:TRINITY_DN4406_c0_g1_i1.p1 TRINITY_DN4406_c0_g1~~TRINITY_DN4406_c0_g1_i1.p1  ORF type:complete len:192 (+),score=11.97 TRINITY_DN4406_c0_g1_i1:47-622(+)
MLRRTYRNSASTSRLGDLFGKQFNPSSYEIQGKRTKRLYFFGISGALFCLYGSITTYRGTALDSESKTKVMYGWRGEYVQDFNMIGQPPMNLNLPPHLRTDQKSYLDLPDTVLQPPPDWETLHPYLQYRFHDLFLSPEGTDLNPYPETQYIPRRTWGSSYMIDDTKISNSDVDDAEAACLHKQRKRKVVAA